MNPGSSFAVLSSDVGGSIITNPSLSRIPIGFVLSSVEKQRLPYAGL